MKRNPAPLKGSATTMNASKTPADLDLFLQEWKRDIRNGANVANAATSHSETTFTPSSASPQLNTTASDGTVLVPAGNPARPAPWANFQPALTVTPRSGPATSATSSTVETTVAAAFETPEYAKEAGTFYDLTQSIDQGSITLQPASRDVAYKWNLGTASQRQTWRHGKLASVHARIRGRPDQFLRQMPVLALRGFWPVADVAITQAGLKTDQVANVVVPVPSEDNVKGLIFILDWMCAIIYSEDCLFVKMPYINTLPTYRNFRVAQTARMIGMTDAMYGMLARINNLRYKGQIYRPDVEDVKMVVKYIAPDHGIRLRLVSMIAQATLDKKLGNKKDIVALMEEIKDFGEEVEGAIQAEKQARAGKKAS